MTGKWVCYSAPGEVSNAMSFVCCVYQQYTHTWLTLGGKGVVCVTFEFREQCLGDGVFKSVFF